MGTLIEIRLLGRFSVCGGDGELSPSAFGGRQARTLMRMLAIRRGQFVSKDLLAEAIWPRQLPANPATALNVLVHRARRALGDASLIVTGPAGCSLVGTGRCRVDTEVFLAHVAAGRDRLAGGQVRAALTSFRTALQGWAGEPLAEDAYEEWAQAFRTRLGHAHVEALEGAAKAASAVGGLDEAASWAEQAIACLPLRETPYLLLAEALALAGDTAAAVEALERLRRVLASELGIEPSDQVAALRARILQPGSPSRAGTAPAQAPPGAHELDEARAMLRDSILRQGPGEERSLQLARIAILAVPDDPTGASRIVDLALIEAGEDVFAQAHALATGAELDAQQGRLDRAEARWAQVEQLFASVGTPGLGAFLRERTVNDATDMLEHLAQLFGGLCDAMAGGPAPFDRGPGLVFTGSPEDGLAEIDAALALAGQLGDHSAQAAWQWHRSEALVALGHDAAARAGARAAVETATLLDEGDRAAASLYALGLAAQAEGDGGAGLAFLLAALDRTRSVTILSSRILVHLAAAILAGGDPTGAEPYLARALFETRLLRAELALSAGAPEADALVAEALAVAPAAPRRRARMELSTLRSLV